MSSLSLMLGLWILCAIVGAGVTHWLFPRRVQRDRLVLAPVVGAAVLIYVAGLASYAGAPMRLAAPVVILASLVASASGLVRARQRRPPPASASAAAIVHGFGFVSACGVMLAVWLFHAWNPYSDVITYVSIADFLQEHSYFTPAVPGPHEPLLSQMALYQGVGFRMGTTFLLALVAGAVRAPLSFDVYMPTLAVGTWICVPAFWFLARRVLILSPLAAWVATLLFSLHPGVSIANPIGGFLPQTYGTAFILLMLALHIRAPGRRDRIRRQLAAGFIGAVVLLTYPEALPFVMLAIGIPLAARALAGRLPWSEAISAGGGPLVISVLLSPIAAMKFPNVIRIQSGAVVGADVGFSLFDYMGLLAGFRSLTLDILQSPGFAYGCMRMVVVAIVLTAAFAAFTASRTARWRLVWVSLPFVFGLAAFGAFGTNPWNASQFGQPWSTYKLATYSVFLFAALWGIGIARLWQGGAVLRLTAAVQVGIVCAFFPAACYVLAKQSVIAIRTMTGVKTDPIAEYKRLPSIVASLPPDMPVNLQIPSEAHKHRQFVAYFLRRPVIADWSDDAYFGYLSPANRKLPIDPQYPVLIYAPSDPAKVAANLVFRRDGLIAQVEYGEGWYGTERDDKDWWRWLEQQGDVDLFVPKAGTVDVRGDLAVVAAKQRTVTLEVVGYPALHREFQVSEQWFAPFDFGTLRLMAGRYRVRIRADGSARRMSPADARIIRMGVRNLTWSLLPD